MSQLARTPKPWPEACVVVVASPPGQARPMVGQPQYFTTCFDCGNELQAAMFTYRQAKAAADQAGVPLRYLCGDCAHQYEEPDAVVDHRRPAHESN